MFDIMKKRVLVSQSFTKIKSDQSVDLTMKYIISGIQFNDKKYNKKLKHCWYMNNIVGIYTNNV